MTKRIKRNRFHEACGRGHTRFHVEQALIKLEELRDMECEKKEKEGG